MGQSFSSELSHIVECMIPAPFKTKLIIAVKEKQHTLALGW